MNIRFRKTIGVEMSACGKTKRAEHVSMLRRAEHEMRRWRRTLRPKQRAKLDMQASSWGRNGGSIVAPKRPPTR